MAAIITDSLRRQVGKLLLDQVLDTTDSDQYYIGIGKSDIYDSTDTIDTLTRCLRDERIARANLQSIKKVTAEDTTFVVTRYDWTSGNIYPAYFDHLAGHPINPSYYVLTDANEVYICLFQPKGPTGIADVRSTVKPSYTAAGVAEDEAFDTADGYRWKLMYSLNAVRANNFLSSNYMPIQFVSLEATDPLLTIAEQQQARLRDASIDGRIVGFRIIDGGSGYSSPTITISGNGTNAYSSQVTTSVVAGEIVSVKFDSYGAGGADYDYASVAVNGGGTGAVIEPIFGPAGGINYDPSATLKANDLMLRVKTDSSEGGTFLIDEQDFRQIVLLKNPLKKPGALTDSSDKVDDLTAKALKSFVVAVSNAANLEADETVTTTGGSGASAFIDEVKYSTGQVFYHQNENTGFVPFTNEEITNGTTPMDIIVSADSSGAGAIVNAFSGEILYIENRARVQRTAGQSEDIKIVLSF